MKRALALLAGLAVMAQAPAPKPLDRPPLAPTRDASVLYRLVPPEGPAEEVRVTTQAGGSPIRVDMADKSWMLVDQRARRMAMVVMAEETVVDLPYQGPPQQFVLSPAMRFVRRGADTVAGVPCTVWDVAVGPQRGVMCITGEGVLLRTQTQDARGRRSMVEALSVSYAPATDAEFTPPPDYERLAAGQEGARP